MKKTTNNNPLNRREFLKYASATGLSLALLRNWANAQSDKPRPNVLFIMTDQQHVNMMSCMGNKYVKTPNLDKLAASGMLFTHTYVTNPICVPSRVSLQTGMMPSVVGMAENLNKCNIPESMMSNSLGALMKNAGYDCGYGGKTHLSQPFQQKVEKEYYEYFCKDERFELADKCCDFIKHKRTKPFFCFASFINPHDICYMTMLINEMNANLVKADANSASNKPKKRNPWITGNGQEICDELFSKLPTGDALEKWVEKNCPPLPDNFEIPIDEPPTITSKYLQKSGIAVREKWTKTQWRLHRWFYCRLTEQADSQIGQVLQALRDSGQEDNTIIIFTSDHGDLDASHKIANKVVQYEESVRVPFIFSYKGFIKPGQIDSTHLVSNGLDLLPTVCDMVNITPPENLPGRSLKPILYGKNVSGWRDYVVSESWYGRMVCDNRFKYDLYDGGKNNEIFTDLKNDPGEMHNLANKKEYQSQVESYRAKLKQWAQKTNDKVALDYLEKLQQPSK